MNEIQLRQMEASDRAEVAELIGLSTNTWYQTHGRPRLFAGKPATADVFFAVYETLDPGCGVVAVSNRSGRLAGSCFFHPRPTHVSLGIMNVHPNYFGCGVARALLQHIIDYADCEQKPLRLVSSALNLDSFSLYTRAGFVPQAVYQDMFLVVPAEGLSHRTEGDDLVREATTDDVHAIAALETELAGITRDKDYRYFLEDRDGPWHVSVYPDERGGVAGFLASGAHPGFTMIGPGVARTPEQAAALVLAELNQCRGRTVLFLVPVQCARLVARMYGWGAKNCEIHFSQVRGPCQAMTGVYMPTFLPESG
jgi:GNAT superfamily N-acetyltransferase